MYTKLRFRLRLFPEASTSSEVQNRYCFMFRQWFELSTCHFNTTTSQDGFLSAKNQILIHIIIHVF